LCKRRRNEFPCEGRKEQLITDGEEEKRGGSAVLAERVCM
jgi:hypothetical protein